MVRVIAAAAAALASVALVLDRSHGATPSPERAAPAESVPRLPAMHPSRFRVRTPHPLALREAAHVWAAVKRSMPVRSRPARRSAVVGRLWRRTPERTTSIVLVIAGPRRRDGIDWVNVRFPNAGRTTGWVPRRALGVYGAVDTTLVVDTRRLRATLYRAGRSVFSARIAVGRPAWPTPRGRFYVRNRLDGLRDPMYGPVAFGTSARSRVLTDWPGGGFVGIHGTDRPELIPGHVSHGCIRLMNADILRLARLMRVGTPVAIR